MQTALHMPLQPTYRSTISALTATTNQTTTPQFPRKRRRPNQSPLSVTWNEIREIGKDGREREVIVIEDTPPPTTVHSPTASLTSVPYTNGSTYIPPIRTRAQAAAAAINTASAYSVAGPSTVKKRKRDAYDEAGPSSSTATYTKRTTAQNPAALKFDHHTAGTLTNRTDDAPLTPLSSQSIKAPSCDDKEGHYIVTSGDVLSNRYRTVRLLGQGTFGKVVEAQDLRANRRVAVKIIRAIPKYRDASRIEMRVLNKLKERDPYNKHNCIHLLDWFDHRNHICLVSELLGMCVYDFLKDNHFQPFPRTHIYEFALQLLDSVAFLHELDLIHTDLKPENILLVDHSYDVIPVNTSVNGKARAGAPKTKKILRSTKIRLIDFGSATFNKEYHSTIVSTRHYRAPEIILLIGWSFPCDVFSLGCILVEFYTGVALFQTHDNLEHLAMMECVMGKMPERLARAGQMSKAEYFTDGAGVPRINFPTAKTSRQSRKEVRAVKRLQDTIPPIHGDPSSRSFLDLVKQLLALDPVQRITVRQALQHPYFTHVPVDG